MITNGSQHAAMALTPVADPVADPDADPVAPAAEPKAPAESPVSTGLADDAPFLPGHVGSTPFGEDSWDITPAITTPNCHSRTVYWDAIRSQDLRYGWKAIAYTRLRHPVADWRAVKAETVVVMSRHAVAAAAILDDMGVTRPSEITPALGAELLRHVKAKDWSPSHAAAVLNAVVQLYAFRDYLVDAPEQHPLKGKTGWKALGVTAPEREENATPRIPEAVMGPILQWALRYVTDFADEILSAPTEKRIQSGWSPVADPSPAGKKQGRVTALLAHYLDGLRRQGRGLPVRPPLGKPGSRWAGRSDPAVVGRVDWRQVSADVGAWIDAAMTEPCRELIDSFIEELGLEPDRRLRPEEPETLANLLGMSWGCNVADVERRYLAIACYIVIAYLTGMRDSEVKGLRRGCLRQKTTADGLRTRWYVRGDVFKHRLTPEQADWVAIKPVVRAVEVLTRLNDVLRTPAEQPLAKVARVVGERLQDWVAHVNQLAARSHSLPVIPVWEHQLNSRQFRRTFAWYIANRPGGVIAGMIQYQQASVAVFEGYHGTSKSGFAGEVERERAVQQEIALMDIFEDWQGGVLLNGAGASALVTAFEEVQAELRGLVNPTDRQVRELLKSKSVHLQVGVLTDCKFHEASARCLQTASKSHRRGAGPIINVCNKRDCPHAVVTERHHAVWQSCIADTEALLQDPALSAPQRMVLEAELRRQLTVLGDATPIEETTA